MHSKPFDIIALLTARAIELNKLPAHIHVQTNELQRDGDKWYLLLHTDHPAPESDHVTLCAVVDVFQTDTGQTIFARIQETVAGLEALRSNPWKG